MQFSWNTNARLYLLKYLPVIQQGIQRNVQYLSLLAMLMVRASVVSISFKTNAICLSYFDTLILYLYNVKLLHCIPYDWYFLNLANVESAQFESLSRNLLIPSNRTRTEITGFFTETQIFFQISVWTKDKSFRASCAPVDTHLFP